MPLILATQSGHSGVFDNNGDGTAASGAISIQSFSGTGTITLQADVYLDFSDTTLCHAEAAIGITNPTIQGWGGYDTYVQFSLQAVGRACTNLTDSLKAHAYFFGSFVTNSGTESFFPTEAAPALFRADAYVGGWHTLKITTDGTGKPKFYVDNTLVYTGANAIANSVLNSANPLYVGSQSSGGAGKAYHDNLSFTNGCTWPAVIAQLSPATTATLCNTLVTLSWTSDAYASEYQVQVDNNANFSSPETDLRIPAPASNVSIVIADDCTARYWRVRGINACGVGGWSSSRSLNVCTTLGVPPLVAPANGAVDLDQPVEIDWDPVIGASSYSFQLDNNSDFSSPVANLTVTPSGYTAALLVGSTTYYWRVRADNTCGHGSWSASRSFTTAVCNLPAIATPQLPVTGSSNQTQPVTLDWPDAALATLYRVQVDEDSLFTSPTIDVEVTPSTTVASGLLAGSMSYWRVRSYNACGWADWSNVFKFSTCSPIVAPALVEPPDSAIIGNSPAFFDWNLVAGADSYLVQIVVATSFDTPNLRTSKMGAGLSQFGSYSLPSSKRYFWRVRAFDDCGWGLYSPTRTCSLQTVLAVDDIDGGQLPSEFTLSQNYPNPFNLSTSIEFDLAEAGWVRIEVYNILGQNIVTLVDEQLGAGKKRVSWNGQDLTGRTVASGVYYYRLSTDNFTATRKMLLLK